MTVLLIEDEYKFARVLQKCLQIERYIVDIACDGKSGLRRALKNEYDIIILDLMLPQKNGIDVCKELRQKRIQTPIIILTARDTVQDRVRGLDIGADDYITKPFDFDELLARIRSVLRRKKTTELPQLKIRNLALDPAAHEVKQAGKLISLCPKEYGLLDYLMRNPNKVISRSELFKHVWHSRFQAKSNIVDVYIRYLRQKIDRGYANKLIYTVRGAGYKIKG